MRNSKKLETSNLVSKIWLIFPSKNDFIKQFFFFLFLGDKYSIKNATLPRYTKIMICVVCFISTQKRLLTIVFIFVRADVAARPFRIGRLRDDNPAGHRAQRRGKYPGVCIHGGSRRPWVQDGRVCDSSRGAWHRAASGPTAAPGDVHGPASVAAAYRSSDPSPDHRLRHRHRRSRAHPSAAAAPHPAATQDDGNLDALTVGSKLSASLCCAQVFRSQDDGRFRSGTGADDALTREYGEANAHIDHGSN